MLKKEVCVLNVIEKELIKYILLKKDLLETSRYIKYCAEQDACFYQDLAIFYSNRLKDFEKFLNENYGIIFCSEHPCENKDNNY